MKNYKILGTVTGLSNKEVLDQKYRLVQFERDNQELIGVEQQFENGQWDMTCGQWCKEDVMDKNMLYIDFGQGWAVTGIQKVLK